MTRCSDPPTRSVRGWRRWSTRPQVPADAPADRRPEDAARNVAGAGKHHGPCRASRLLGRLLGRESAEEPRRVLDDAMLESLEEVLIQADMGVETALRVTANIAEGRFGKRMSSTELRAALAAEIARIMEPVARPVPLYPQKPAGGAGGGGQRLGQDHDHRQAGQPVQGGGQIGGDRGGRHVPRGGGGTVAGLGRTRRRAGADRARRVRPRQPCL